jgi:hypothetical protein
MRLRVLAGTLCLLILFALSGWAQVATSRLEGTVQDPTGAVIPNAKVVAVNSKTQARAEATSDGEGNFIFASLLPGIYNLSVEAPSFRKSLVNNIELTVGETIRQIVKMEVGTTAESVVVEASAVTVQTTESQISRAVTMKQIDTLPQLGRTPITLAAFQPGVSINPGDATFSRINGNRQGSNNSRLDGIDVNDSLVPRLGLSLTSNNTDSIGEFRIITSGGKAEYGRNAGGQVELITRSGTNQFHGNAFDYLRNTDLNANDFFNNASGIARPKFIQNIYGGSFGGPILKNRTFIFGNFQGRRTRQEVIRNRTVLTPAAKQGIFSWRNTVGGPVQTYDIVANDPRRLGIDPEVKKNFGMLPDPNNFDIGDGLNTAGFRFNNSVPSYEDQFTIRGDHNLTSTHRIFMRWSWQRNSSADSLNNADATFPGQPTGTQGGKRWGFSIGSDWSIRPNLINEFRTGYQSSSVDFFRPREPRALIVSNLFTDPLTTAFAQGRNSPVNDTTENLTWIKGNHTIKGGANIRWTTQWGYNDAGIYPNINTARTLGNIPASSVGPQGLSTTNRNQFENLYNDVLGRVSSVDITYNSDLATYQPAGTTRERTYKLREYGFFIQDDWKVRRNLTFNIGLRYEIFGSPFEANGLQGTFDKINLVNDLARLKDLTVVKNNQFYGSDLNNFAPRFGFAWDVFGDGKTAIRGSYGIFFDRQIGATINSVDGATPGFSSSLQNTPNTSNNDVRVSDKPGVPPAPSSVVLTQPVDRVFTTSVFNPNLRTGYVHQYSLTIQREVMRGTIVEGGYVGSRGVKLFFNRDLNQQNIWNDFLPNFKQLQVCQANAAACQATTANNTIVRIFGTPAAAISALGASNFQLGAVGAAATNLDRSNYQRYASAGVSDYYLRSFPQFNGFRYGTNDGHSYYDSLQVSVRRFVGDLRVTGNYTFSKSMDNISVEGNGFTAPTDSYNLRLSRTLSDVDRPHVFNATAIYTLPFGKGKKFVGNAGRLTNMLIGGWDLGTIFLIQSGAPLTISSNRNTVAGNINSFMNYNGKTLGTGSVQVRGDGVWYFTPQEVANFSFPGAGEYGNTNRNAFRLQRFWNLDASIVKRFAITERHAVTFRAEMYNVTNTPNFTGISVNLNTAASTFGKFSSTTGIQGSGGRIMQLALRYDF